MSVLRCFRVTAGIQSPAGLTFRFYEYTAYYGALILPGRSNAALFNFQAAERADCSIAAADIADSYDVRTRDQLRRALGAAGRNTIQAGE